MEIDCVFVSKAKSLNPFTEVNFTTTFTKDFGVFSAIITASSLGFRSILKPFFKAHV